MRIEFAFYDGETRGTNADKDIEAFTTELKAISDVDKAISIKRKDNQFTTVLNGEVNINDVTKLTTESVVVTTFRKMHKFAIQHIAKEWRDRFNTMGWVMSFDLIYDIGIDETHKAVKDISAEIERHFDKITHNKNAHFGICVNELSKDYRSNDTPHIVVSININAPTVEKQMIIEFARVFKCTLNSFLEHRVDSFKPIINISK